MLGQLRDSGNLPEGEDIQAPEAAAKEPVKDTLRVLIDRKARKGKTATIVEGFTVSDEEVASVAAMLKRRLGVGGSARGGEILIQGDLAEKVRELLRSEGYKVVSC